MLLCLLLNSRANSRIIFHGQLIRRNNKLVRLFISILVVSFIEYAPAIFYLSRRKGNSTREYHRVSTKVKIEKMSGRINQLLNE